MVSYPIKSWRYCNANVYEEEDPPHSSEELLPTHLSFDQPQLDIEAKSNCDGCDASP